MTEMSGACDISDLEDDTTLIGSGNDEYMFFSGFELVKLSTEDKIIDSK